MNEPEKDLPYYRSLPYAIEILPSSEGGFVAHYPALPGCAVEGDDVTGTLAALDEGRDLWIRAKLEAGEPVPEPAAGEPSGRLMLRVPIRLHQQLDGLARDHSTSLNKMTSELLLNYANALPPWYGLGEPTAAGEARHPAYSYRLTPQPEGGYVAEHLDLPGCAAAGDDPEEAMAELDQARELWLEARQEVGLEEEPEPLSGRHSGTIHLRMPPELHADLIRQAKRNEISLNQMMIFVLAEAVGELQARRLVVLNEHPEPGVSEDPEPGRSNGQAGWKEEPDVAEQIESAVHLLRRKPNSSDTDLPPVLPLRATSFLRAMVHLERHGLEEAFESFQGAAKEGLDFAEEALFLFEKIPGRLSSRALYHAALPITHLTELPSSAVDGPDLADDQRSFCRQVKCYLMEFVEGVRAKESREEQERRLRRREHWTALAAAA